MVLWGSLLLYFILAFAAGGVSSADTHDSDSQCANLDAQIHEKRKYYEKLFPDIYFLILKGGEAWTEEMVVLATLLGHKPISLDYEHPADLREDLLFASVRRIQIMLQYQSPSASLFKADHPLGWPENICVITLDPEVVAGNHERATKHFEIRGRLFLEYRQTFHQM